MSIPDHISARHEDLEVLFCRADCVRPAGVPHLDPVAAATTAGSHSMRGAGNSQRSPRRKSAATRLSFGRYF